MRRRAAPDRRAWEGAFPPGLSSRRNVEEDDEYVTVCEEYASVA